MALLGGLMDRLRRGTDHDLSGFLQNFPPPYPARCCFHRVEGGFESQLESDETGTADCSTSGYGNPEIAHASPRESASRLEPTNFLAATLQAHREVDAYVNAKRLAGELEE
jgi:hypothetical protein